MTIGDIAFCVLGDLFLNADWTETTIPGAGWNEMLAADDNLPGWDQLNGFIVKHGRKALQGKWQALGTSTKIRYFGMRRKGVSG